jgi:alpha-L-arabinofuranosidase
MWACMSSSLSADWWSAEPDLAIDSGFGSAREAAEEVEYCNGSVETRMGKLRAENGRRSHSMCACG